MCKQRGPRQMPTLRNLIGNPGPDLSTIKRIRISFSTNTRPDRLVKENETSTYTT